MRLDPFPLPLADIAPPKDDITSDPAMMILLVGAGLAFVILLLVIGRRRRARNSGHR